VQGYRQAHALAERSGAGGRQGTEELRQALVAARELFDELLAGDVTSAPAGKETPAMEPDPEPEAAQPEPANADTDAPTETDDAQPRTLGRRFAALTGSGRKAHQNGSEHL
jgi:hypothetical protein